jgi:hypothetical protein
MPRLLTVFSALLLASPVMAQTTFTVTSTADAGAGSLRSALEQAALASGASILLMADGPIVLESGLVYTGTGPLNIIGKLSEISTSENITLLSVTQGAELYIRDLRLSGPGGFGIETRGDLDAPAGKGISLTGRPDQRGVLRMTLDNVRIADVAGEGVFVSDCGAQGDCVTEGDSTGQGAPAGVEVQTSAVEIVDVGYGTVDAAGLRVNERGAGDIRFTALSSRFAGAGSDGVALDEGQDGDVIARVTASVFERNGGYCHPDMLVSYLPEETGGTFAKGDMAEVSLPGTVTDSPDDRCFDRAIGLHDDGSVANYEFTIHTQDGFDVSEAGNGSVRIVVDRSGVLSNLDRGLTVTEHDAGHVDLVLYGSVGRDNTGAAFRSTEAGPGDVTGGLISVIADGNGGAGAIFEEHDDGDLRVSVKDTRTQYNDDNKTGLNFMQAGAGEGVVILSNSQIDDGLESEGVATE